MNRKYMFPPVALQDRALGLDAIAIDPLACFSVCLDTSSNIKPICSN